MVRSRHLASHLNLVHAVIVAFIDRKHEREEDAIIGSLVDKALHDRSSRPLHRCGAVVHRLCERFRKREVGQHELREQLRRRSDPLRSFVSCVSSFAQRETTHMPHIHRSDHSFDRRSPRLVQPRRLSRHSPLLSQHQLSSLLHQKRELTTSRHLSAFSSPHARPTLAPSSLVSRIESSEGWERNWARRVGEVAREEERWRARWVRRTRRPGEGRG